MLHIYQADSSWFRAHFRLPFLLEKLPAYFHERALRYQFERDAFNFVLGKLMLQKGLENLGASKNLEAIISSGAFGENENGKPMFSFSDEKENIFFNISHSENLVVCALTKHGEIGIDVEQERKLELSDFRSVFLEEEWACIQQADFPLKKFYWYWTRKEAIIKALGISISYLNQIKIDATRDLFFENKKKWYLKDLDLGENIFGAICTEFEIEKIQMYCFGKLF